MRPVTLFTGQWADLPLESLAARASEWGFDGLELACWGDHFEVDRALADAALRRAQARSRSNTHGLAVLRDRRHLVGQAVCDPIDERHRGTCRRRSGATVTRRACSSARRGADEGYGAGGRAPSACTQVNGFTGSPIWHLLYSFPPNDFDAIDRGYERFAERWRPIIDVFDAEGVRFGLEVHPTEIAYDFVTTRRTLDAIGHRPGFGINFDPSHFVYQFLDSAAFVEEFADRIYHVHVKDAKRS